MPADRMRKTALYLCTPVVTCGVAHPDSERIGGSSGALRAPPRLYKPAASGGQHPGRALSCFAGCGALRALQAQRSGHLAQRRPGHGRAGFADI